MKISSEELEKARLKLIKDQKENIKYYEKETYYKELIKEGNFEIKLTWIEKFENIDMEFLNSILDSEFFDDFRKNFSVVRLHLNRVLNFHCGSESEANEIYPKNELWAEHIGRSNRSMVKILEHVESGLPLCPPIIDISSDDILLFYDGNHRVAIARYLGYDEIPFAVRSVNIERLLNL